MRNVWIPRSLETKYHTLPSGPEPRVIGVRNIFGDPPNFLLCICLSLSLYLSPLRGYLRWAVLSWGSWAVPAGRSLALNLRIPSDPPKLPSDKSPALRDPGFGPNLICGRVHLLCFRKWDLPKQYVLQFTIYNLFSASPANVHPPCSRIWDMEIWEDLAPILARNGPLGICCILGQSTISAPSILPVQNFGWKIWNILQGLMWNCELKQKTRKGHLNDPNKCLKENQDI